MMVNIANPIYDSVFKYLMEDERIAKTLISALLKKDFDQSLKEKGNHQVLSVDEDTPSNSANHPDNWLTIVR